MESRHNKYPREENEFWSTLEVDIFLLSKIYINFFQSCEVFVREVFMYLMLNNISNKIVFEIKMIFVVKKILANSTLK